MGAKRGKIMSRKRSVAEGSGAAGLVMITVLIQALFFASDGIEFADTIDFSALSMYKVTTLGAGEKGDIKAVKVNHEGQKLVHGEALRLMGEIDFDGLPGDILVFKYDDDAWVEIARYLTDEES